MKIKFSKRLAAILFATGVSVALRACNGTLAEASSNDYQASNTSISSTDERYNTKEGYILESNFDLIGVEKIEETEKSSGTKR